MNKIVCSWCGKLIKPGSPPTSHGICAECKRKVLAGIKTETEREVK